MIKNSFVYRLGTTTYVPLGETTFAITDTGSTSFIDKVPEGARPGTPSDDNGGKTPTGVRAIIEVVARIADKLRL